MPATVSVTTTEDIERENMQDVRDLVRNEPGVTVGNNPNRAGFQNFLIRGIGGNRVLVIVDGMRVPDFPESNQGAGTYSREQPDLEDIKRVEIIRGPASALYGSDAIGGVVAYTTKDPGEYVREGENVYGSVKSAYSGANQMFAETFTGAVKTGKLEFLGIYTRRDGQQFTPAQSSLGPNPTTWFNNNFLAKIVIRPTEVDVIRITGGYSQGQQTTQALSGVGVFPSLVTRVYDEWGKDYTNTYRLSGQWEHTAPIAFIDRINLLVYYNSTNTQADTYTLRGATLGIIPTNARASTFLFNQSVSGAELQMNTDATFFGLRNFLTYGLSFTYTDTTRPRNRAQITLATGATTQVVGGETYPNKNFPDTTTVQGGAYIQDEITALDGKLVVTPAVRLDYYSLTPNPDKYFWNSTGATLGIVPSASTYVSASPKLGVLYHFNDRYSSYFQYATGFRAPPYDNANFGFTNTASFYQILPNANLKPETANSFEVGFRGKYPAGNGRSRRNNRVRGQAALSRAAQTGGLSRARHRTRSARRGPDPRAPRPRRCGGRNQAMAQQRLRGARPVRARRRPRLAIPPGDARRPCRRRLGRNSRSFPPALKRRLSCFRPRMAILPPAGHGCATNGRCCAFAMPPRHWVSAKPSWWPWASAGRQRCSRRTGAQFSMKCRPSAGSCA